MSSRCIIEAKLAEVALTTQYTAPARGTNAPTLAFRVSLDQFSIGPPAAGTETLSVYLVPFGSSAGASNLFLTKSMAAGAATYTCPELIGHILEPGDFIATSATAATIPIRACGELELAPT